MTINNVTMRCDCGSEAIVFSVYDYDSFDSSYELSFEDSYISNNYNGFLGRLKRAWHAFKAKPVSYTSVYTEDKEKMKKFFTECLEKLD